MQVSQVKSSQVKSDVIWMPAAGGRECVNEGTCWVPVDRYASAARAFISPTAFEQARGQALWEREAAGSGSLGAASSESAAGSVRLSGELRLLSRPRTKRVLSPELQECMDTNERSAATGAHGKEPRTPKR